jgi:hypothetical protein
VVARKHKPKQPATPTAAAPLPIGADDSREFAGQTTATDTLGAMPEPTPSVRVAATILGRRERTGRGPRAFVQPDGTLRLRAGSVAAARVAIGEAQRTTGVTDDQLCHFEVVLVGEQSDPINRGLLLAFPATHGEAAAQAACRCGNVQPEHGRRAAPDVPMTVAGHAAPAGTPDPSRVTVHAIGRCPVKGCRNRKRNSFPGRVHTDRYSTHTRWSMPTANGGMHPAPTKLPARPSTYVEARDAEWRRRSDAAYVEGMRAHGWVCEAHDQFMRVAAVEGVVNVEKACNARCMGATGPACECACGGELHGARWD